MFCTLCGDVGNGCMFMEEGAKIISKLCTVGGLYLSMHLSWMKFGTIVSVSSVQKMCKDQLYGVSLYFIQQTQLFNKRDFYLWRIKPKLTFANKNQSQFTFSLG